MADSIKSTDIPEVHGMVVVNPDGTSISGGTVNGVAAYADVNNADKKGLVDADRHVQVDVLTMPEVSLDTTGLATESKQDTGNASLSSIDTKTPPLGQALAAASVPVVLPSAQISTLTPQTDALTDAELRATPIPVDTGLNQPLEDGGSVVVSSGSVTANAGTNLNTSALAVESGGNLASAATSLSLIDDTIFIDDTAFTPATSKVQAVGFEVDETGTDSVDEGDIGAARMSANRNQYIQIRDAAGNERGANVDSSNRLAVLATQSGNYQVTGGNAIDASLTTSPVTISGRASATAPADVSADGDVQAVWILRNGSPVINLASGGTLLTGDGTNGLDVDVTRIVPGTGATNLGKAEDAGHSSGDSGVFALGVRNDTLATSTNTDGDYSQISTDLKGRVMVGSAPRTLKANQVTTITSSTSETTIVTAVTSTFLDLYGLIVTNTSASAVNVAIKDATGGTTRLNIAVPAGDTRGFMLPIDAAIKQAASNNNWTATCSSSVSSVIITALTVANI